MGCSEKWSFNSLQVVQRFAGEERELSDHRVFQFLIGSLEIRCGPCSRRSAWLVSIPYRQSRDPVFPSSIRASLTVSIPYRQSRDAPRQMILEGEIVFQFLIGSLEIHRDTPRPCRRYIVSIPYRQSRDTIIRLVEVIPYNVSIPYRQSRDRCGPCSRRSAWPVSIPYRQSRDPRLAIPNNFAFSSFNSLQVVQRSKQVATPIIAIHGFNSLQVVQRFDLGSYLGVKKVVVSIPYRQSRDPNSASSRRGNSRFQFLIGSLEIARELASPVVYYRFQFLIGSLEITCGLILGCIPAHVSIPYRQSRDASEKFHWICPYVVSIPYRQSRDVRAAHSSAYGEHVSIPYRQSRDITTSQFFSHSSSVSIPYRQSRDTT